MEVKKPDFWSWRGLPYFVATVAAAVDDDGSLEVEVSAVCLLPSSFSKASVVWLMYY